MYTVQEGGGGKRVGGSRRKRRRRGFVDTQRMNVFRPTTMFFPSLLSLHLTPSLDLRPLRLLGSAVALGGHLSVHCVSFE